MGADKAAVEIDGESMLSRVLRATSHLGPAFVVGGEPSLLDDAQRAAPDQARQVSYVPDAVPGAGPFAAVVTALRLVETTEALVVSCDLAHPNRQDIDLLVASRRASNADIALPLVEGERQWHALAISMRVAPVLFEAHDLGVRSLRAGFQRCSQVAVCSPSKHFFSDVDTPEQLSAARSASDGLK